MTGWALRCRRPGCLLGGVIATSASTTTLCCGRSVDTADRVGVAAAPMARKPQQPLAASAMESRAKAAAGLDAGAKGLEEARPRPSSAPVKARAQLSVPHASELERHAGWGVDMRQHTEHAQDVSGNTSLHIACKNDYRQAAH